MDTKLALLIVFIVFGAALHFAILGAWIAPQKRRPWAQGAILGLLYGPVGVIVLALLPDGDEGETWTAPVGRQPVESPWLDEFGDPRPTTPPEVAWLSDLERRAQR